MDESAQAERQIGVFLLDDHEIVRRGVKDLLEAESDITVVGEAGTAASALARIPALKPDVAVLDVRLPDGDGVSVCRDIRSKMPDVACLMLTSYGDDEALFDAIMAGAAGYVLKQIRGTDLVGAVRTVAFRPETLASLTFSAEPFIQTTVPGFATSRSMSTMPRKVSFSGSIQSSRP